MPAMVRDAIRGDTSRLNQAYAVYQALLDPVVPEPPPTYQNVVINFHRCNVWFPRSNRAEIRARHEPTRFLNYVSFIDYWDQICSSYDSAGEFPFAATASTPASVPVLSWVGDRDFFDPETVRERWSGLTSRLSFHVMPGWAHDFGPDSELGQETVIQMIKAFLAE